MNAELSAVQNLLNLLAPKLQPNNASTTDQRVRSAADFSSEYTQSLAKSSTDADNDRDHRSSPAFEEIDFFREGPSQVKPSTNDGQPPPKKPKRRSYVKRFPAKPDLSQLIAENVTAGVKGNVEATQNVNASLDRLVEEKRNEKVNSLLSLCEPPAEKTLADTPNNPETGTQNENLINTLLGIVNKGQVDGIDENEPAGVSTQGTELIDFVEPSGSDSKRSVDPELVCDVCCPGYEFKNRSGLKSHLLLHKHIHLAALRDGRACEKCGKSTADDELHKLCSCNQSYCRICQVKAKFAQANNFYCPLCSYGTHRPDKWHRHVKRIVHIHNVALSQGKSMCSDERCKKCNPNYVRVYRPVKRKADDISHHIENPTSSTTDTSTILDPTTLISIALEPNGSAVPANAFLYNGNDQPHNL